MYRKFKNLSKYYEYGGDVEKWARAYSGKTVEVRQSKSLPSCWEIVDPFIGLTEREFRDFDKGHFEEKTTFNIKINTRKIY